MHGKRLGLFGREECTNEDWIARLRYCLLGSALSNRNLGVTALAESVILGIVSRIPDAHLVIFDNGTGGVSSQAIQTSNGECIVDLCGARPSKRLYLPDAYARIRFAARLGGLWNPAARYLLKADAILDISGGDSFTDLYGTPRFGYVNYLKLVALENRKHLILLPQTYGPFSTAKFRRVAEGIVRSSAMAWARDERSFETLRELLGDEFDPEHHKCGVDVAFSLKPRDPGAKLSPDIRNILETENNDRPIGVNISGLIYNDPTKAREHYGFVSDYRLLNHSMLIELAERTQCPIILIPHVLTPAGNYESDPGACDLVLEMLPENVRSRVLVIPPDFNASEMKWIISRCQWFCGMRMHSTIAGLSTGVPTSAIAYSLKTQGVFETCGLGESVVDPRVDDTMTCVEKLLDLFDRRSELKITLDQHLPQVLQQAEQQFDQLVEFVCQASKQRIT